MFEEYSLLCESSEYERINIISFSMRKRKTIYDELATPKAYRVMQVLNNYRYKNKEDTEWF